MGNLTSVIAGNAPEAALIQELQAGSEDAFAWLITRYHQPIYSLLVRTVRDPADAADLTQEVFVKVFRGIGGFHQESSLCTWIYRIALHEGLNQRRWWARHKRQEITLETETGGDDGDERLRLMDMLEDPADKPDEMLFQREAHQRLEDALQKLPEPFRMTVILRDVEGFSYEEIAQMLGIHVGTVKSRLARGRSSLRQILKRASTNQTCFTAPPGVMHRQEAS